MLFRSAGERQNLRRACEAADVDLGELLRSVGVNVDPNTLDGLTKEQWRLAKTKLG